MGRPKPLLRQVQSGKTFVRHLIGVASAAGLVDIFVIGRPEDLQLRQAVSETAAAFVANPEADRGQLSSLLVGLAAAQAPDLEGIMVMPVDVPLISSAVLRRLLAAAELEPSSIVRATHHGIHGHPVLFKRAVFEELRAADVDVGARAVLRADPSRVSNVEVGDAGVTLDLDTPEDYLRAFGRQL
jgi:CTP:molybdopterin cytidylyltransferase MocA